MIEHYFRSTLKFLIILIPFYLFNSCSEDFTEDDTVAPEIEVVLSDIPYNTEKYIRIGYTLRTWEFEKDSLQLSKILVLDASNKSEIYKIEGDLLESIKVYKSPLPFSKYFLFDKLSSYYFSIQLPIINTNAIPSSIMHRLVFLNTRTNQEVIKEGAQFSPATSELPIEISSPVRGSNWRLTNQSTMAYHFNTLYHVNGKIHTGDRYASDFIQLNDQGKSYSGDSLSNMSFYSYKENLHAVADGKVVKIQDGRSDNLGKKNNGRISSANELAGNYIVIDIGNNKYAIYANCFPNSFMVEEKDSVKVGQVIALLGNSGYSTEPHLHFQISSSPEIFFSRGIPYTLKHFKKIREFPNGVPEEVEYHNSIPEENSIVSFFETQL